MNIITYSFVAGMIVGIMVGVALGILYVVNTAHAEKRECKDLVSSEQYNSEGHNDNKESNKEFKKSIEQDTLCKFTEKHDKEQIEGVVKDWTDFKESRVYQTATHEQKECLKEYFDLPDDGHKALQGYEAEYCGWDDD